MNRRVPGILLLLCFATPLIISYCFLQYHKHQIKDEMDLRLKECDKEESVLLIFAVNEIESKLHWEHSREFEFEGQMYDVCEKILENDSIFIWCYKDDKETKIKNQIEKLLVSVVVNDQDLPSDNNFSFDLSKKLFYDYCTKTLEIKCHIRREQYFYINDLVSFFDSPPVPPPRFS